MAEQDIPPPTITAMKIPIIRKGEYDIWSMRMRQYICHTDHNLWDVIVNGDLEEEPAPTGETSAPPAPKTAKQLAAKRNQERVKSILLLAIPDEYLLKFHNVADAKSLWEAIKSRFGGNEESKKMQKNVLKHQFENFSTASNESLDKAYDRFQKLISQLEVHGAPISKEDINQKFLRSLPPSWNQIALIMRNKPDIDEIDIDDLYNNLRVYEDEMKRSSSSTSTSQNLAFLSSKNTSSTNEVSTASGDFGVSTTGGISQVSSTPCAHDVASKGFILPNHDTGRILQAESQRNTTDPLVVVTDSSATKYDSADESLVCSTPLPPLKKLDGAEPISGPKTIKSILKSKSTLKAKTLKGVKINEPSSAPAKGNKSSSASKVNSALAGKLKSVKIKDDPPLAIVMKELNDLKLQISKNQSSYSRRDERTDHEEQVIPLNTFRPRSKSQRSQSRFPRPSESSTQEDIKLKKPITSHLYESLDAIKFSKPSGCTTSTLLKMKEIYLITYLHPLMTFLKRILKRTSVQDTILIPNSSLSIPSMLYLAPQDRWSQDKHIELVNIIRNPGAGMLTRAMAKELGAASAYELNTPMVPPNKLGPDLNGKAICETQLRGMFGSLIYLNVSRPDTQVSLISVNEIEQILRNPTLLLLRELSDFSALVFRKLLQVSIKRTLRKSLLPPRWRLLMAQIIQCLGGKTGGFDQITNKDAIILYSLANGINIDYSTIFWEDIIIKLKKKQREKVVPYTRFFSLLALKPNQPEEPPFTDHMLAICVADKPVVFKAPKTSSKAMSVSQGTKLGAQTRHKKPLTSSKQPSMSSKQTTKGGSSKQATGGPTSLGVTSEERANPQVNNGMSAFNLNKPIFLASFIIHSESASGCDASADSTAKADPGLSTPNDSIPQQQGMDKGTKNTSYDHIFAGTDPHVLVDQTKSVSEGLETVLTQPITGKGSSSNVRKVKEEESSNTIKLEDLAKLVSNVEPSFKYLDSPEDDPVIIVDDSDEDEEDKVHSTPNAKTKDTSVSKSSSLRSSQIQELTNQVLILQSQKHKLELENNKVEAEVALLKAQTSFPNILSTNDFSSSLPTELKDLPSKFNDLTKEVKGIKNQVHNQEIELPEDLKEIPPKLEDFTMTVTSLTSQIAKLKTLQWELPAEFLDVPSQVEMVQAKLKTLDALPSLLNKVTNALNQFAQAITSKKTGGDNVPLAGQAEDEGKKALSLEEAEKESTNSDFDDETHVTGSMVEPSRTKKLKKFDFITEDGRHIHLTEEEINHLKKLKEDAKAEAAKQEGDVRKIELVDLLGPEVVKKYYNDKLQYDKYCDKMLNRRAVSRIINCDVLTIKGPITLKVYREDGTSEIIPNFKASDLHLGTRMDYIHMTEAELGINLDIPLSKQDPLDKLNDLANKKRKHADDIHDYFKANKRIKSSVQYEYHLPGTVLNELVLEIFFRLHQGPRLDDHARTFSSLLLAEVDKRNLNPLKKMRIIEQLSVCSGTETKEGLLERASVQLG
ncbi:hypothetical protein Tco_0414742 [Tanacetum coccineum]